MLDAKTHKRFDANWTPEPNTGCFLWFGVQRNNRGGYGGFNVGGKMRLAHRLAWEWANGRSAKGQVVRHQCDTPECVNPAHLEIGTQADNARDRNMRGRHAHGEHHGKAKLTDQIVREIRRLLIDGIESQRSIARRHGVNPKVIIDIKRGLIWRHAV
jgi:hypothetical protein